MPVFEDEKNMDTTSLMQGDVLQRTNDLLDSIRQAHSYYAEAPDYEFFMVLTQSCDLVRRRGKPNTRYITLAAVRPLDILIDRLLERIVLSAEGIPIKLYPKQNEALVCNMLERLMHNTADGYFFLKQGSHSALPKHYCTFLSLSIALRVDHYDACLGAKVAQLKDIFQAKLGWLAGNLYSRVGTPDEEGDHETIKTEFLESVLYQRSLWVTPEQRRQLLDMAKANPPNSESEARELAERLKDDIQVLAERIASAILPEYVKSQDMLERITNRIASDRVIARIVRG
jgi:hypothetical protein